MRRSSTRALTECALLVALSACLSMIPLFRMPLGGTVTPLSMVPVCLISLRRGTRWGLGSCFVYSLLQLGIGLAEGLAGWGLTPVMLLGCVCLDYLLAFSVLGLAGVFRRRGTAGFLAGCALAIALRFGCHFVSGFVIFSHLDGWEFLGRELFGRPALYSLCYNGLFMLPELVFSLVGVWLLGYIPYFGKHVFTTPQN